MLEADVARVAIRSGLRHRGAAITVVADALGRPSHELELLSDEHGRPLVRARGADPRISVAHTDDLTLVAVTLGVDVGVDVERLDRQVADWVLWKQILTVDETDLLPDDRWGRNATLLWSWVRREAVLKAAGVGLGVEPRSIELGSTGDIVALPSGLGAVADWVLVDLLIPGCAAAIAFRFGTALATLEVECGEDRSILLCPFDPLSPARVQDGHFPACVRTLPYELGSQRLFDPCAQDVLVGQAREGQTCRWESEE